MEDGASLLIRMEAALAMPFFSPSQGTPKIRARAGAPSQLLPEPFGTRLYRGQRPAHDRTKECLRQVEGRGAGTLA